MVTYHPFGGVPKTFRAIVDRLPAPIQSAGQFQYALNTLAVTFPRDATDGMASVQPRKDRVSFKRNLSDADVTMFSIQKILQEDAGITPADGGMFVVEVTA